MTTSPLIYFKWMFDIYTLFFVGLCLTSLLSDCFVFGIICMEFVFVCGFIADVIGMDIWRLENENSKNETF